MAAHKSNQRGTLMVDRIFPPPIGRLRRATGLTDPAELTVFLETMLPALRQQTSVTAEEIGEGPLRDVLLAVREKRVTVKRALDLWRAGKLHEIASAASLVTLAAAMRAYVRERTADGETDAEHLRKMGTTANHLTRLCQGFRIRDMRLALTTLKRDLGPSAFNQARNHLRAFARDTYGRSSAAYKAVRDSTPRKKGRRQKGRPYAPSEIRTAAESLSLVEAQMLWTLCTTGMMPEEYWEEDRCRWYTEPGRIHIDGTKRDARVRDVPLILPPVRPVIAKRKFAKRLKEVLGSDAVLYNTRRTYGRWLAEARIIGVNQKAYMGHGVTITELYQRGEIEGQLAQDRTALRNYLNLEADPVRVLGVVG